MTLPDERTRALLITKELLIDLCSSAKTPRVPKIIRERAKGCLRHYPTLWDLQLASQSAPNVFQVETEPVILFLTKNQESKKNAENR